MLLVYALTLVAAVLVSERAQRTVLSTAVLFLFIGATVGQVRGPASSRSVQLLADLALVTVLFTDGLRLSVTKLREAWALPGRALLLGFPLTLGGTAVAARLLTELSWPEALLVGAALAPTDPVFASAIVGREEVPARLRHLLNVESGVNDGLALPFLVAFLAWSGSGTLEPLSLGTELAMGILLGVAIPSAAVRLERSAVFGAAPGYRAVGVVSVGLLVYATTRVVHANEFLASFTAGVTLATVAPRAPAALGAVGEVASELLKLGALLVFGSILSVGFLGELPIGGWLFAVVALVAIRPIALTVALARSSLSVRERAVAAWFGPKGFASVVYGLLIVSSGLPRGDLLFHLVATTTALSIVVHSSTDVPVARWLEKKTLDGYRRPAHVDT